MPVHPACHTPQAWFDVIVAIGSTTSDVPVTGDPLNERDIFSPGSIRDGKRMDLTELALLVIALVLATVIFYVSSAIVGQDWDANSSFILRIIVVAVIAVIVIPVFQDAADHFQLGAIGLLFAFVLLIIVVRFVIVDELTVSDDWLASIVVSLIGVVLIYLVDEVASRLFDVRLLSIF